MSRDVIVLCLALVIGHVLPETLFTWKLALSAVRWKLLAAIRGVKGRLSTIESLTVWSRFVIRIPMVHVTGFVVLLDTRRWSIVDFLVTCRFIARLVRERSGTKQSVFPTRVNFSRQFVSRAVAQGRFETIKVVYLLSLYFTLRGSRTVRINSIASTGEPFDRSLEKLHPSSFRITSSMLEQCVHSLRLQSFFQQLAIIRNYLFSDRGNDSYC